LTSLLAELRAAGVEVRLGAPGKILVTAAKAPLTDDQVAALRLQKNELLTELYVEERETRRALVIAELEENPDLRYAWRQTTSDDGTTMILTAAIRGVGSAELTADGEFDPFKFLNLTSRHHHNRENPSCL
jgi:hypothetical protein